MNDATAKWTYVKAWERPATSLGVQIEGPVRITVSPNIVLEAEMLVRGFGARRGTLVFKNADRYPSFLKSLHEQGLTASSFGPYGDGETCSLVDLVDVLGDWGWCGEGAEPSWLVTIDAEGWSRPSDFYRALLTRLKAPKWHGQNLDALWDSITSSGINGLDPPFAVRLFNTERLSREMSALIERVEGVFRDAANAGIPVALHVWP